MSEISAIILAAGVGKRMKSKHPKVLHKICAKPMINWVIDSCKEAGIMNWAVVIGAMGEQIKTYLGPNRKYYVQTKQLGTGHAVMAASEFIKESSGDIIVLYGDVPLLRSSTLDELIKYHQKNNNDATVLTSFADDPRGYGRIIRDFSGNVKKIIEHKDATLKEKEINEINSGIIIFKSQVLHRVLSEINNDNEQKEYYLTDAIEIINSYNMRIGAYSIDDFWQITGINDRIQLAVADKMARRRINDFHMLNGVTINDPDNTYIGPDVIIEKDVHILPGCRIEGKCKIGEDSIIGPGSTIEDSIIGDKAKIENSTVIESEIGNNTSVGPYAYIRPESIIGDDVRIGDFVEIKKSRIGSRTKISHLTYVGDAIIGQNCNFGCGVVVVNYDGKKKHLTVVGDNAFIGCNVNLIAPIEIEKDTFIAAGSTITKKVPEKALAIAREKQTNIANWVERKDMFRK